MCSHHLLDCISPADSNDGIQGFRLLMCMPALVLIQLLCCALDIDKFVDCGEQEYGVGYVASIISLVW